ncbi:MAG: hypothetical protein DCF19_15825 [Pseudanabaena frigida]|uniref:Uncharacterized protein n=1 Tax=Pseudanabaena frigida TaxID=945775 RepID=A0A2W4W9Q7_9CYAN|nr:MAG: hypothetical protein DCF19_15825 [Pseudanabaena frigida]
MSNTEFDLLNSEIWNCDKLLEFRCPQSWAGLTETSNQTERYCQTCQKNVHLCSTPNEFIAKGKLGHCVAIPIELTPSHALIPIVVGSPNQEKVRKWHEASQKSSTWWLSVLSQKTFFTALTSNLALTAVRRIMASNKFRIRSNLFR